MKFSINLRIALLAIGIVVSITAADTPLNGLKVAILVTDGFEKSEFNEPKKALDDAGAKTSVISDKKNTVKAWHNNNWSSSINVDVQLNSASPKDYDALLLPGGVINPDKLRIIPAAIQFIKEFLKDKKPIAAICHGPWTLINAQGVKGHTLTSWPSLQVDLENAGAKWVDEPVVTDKLLVTSRKPEDIPEYNQAMIKLFAASKK